MAWQPTPPAPPGSLPPPSAPTTFLSSPCVPPWFSVCLCHLLKFPSATWLTFLPLSLFLDLSPNPSLLLAFPSVLREPGSSLSSLQPPFFNQDIYWEGSRRGASEGRASQVCICKCPIGPILAPLDVPLAKGSLKVKDSLGIGQVSVSQIIKWSLNLAPSRVAESWGWETKRARLGPPPSRGSGSG